MIRLVVFIFSFPICLFGQLSKQEETKLYTQALTEYIKSVNATDKFSLDTLFVGPMDKDVDENIKDIELPTEILNTKILKLTQEEGDRKVKYKKTFIFANIIGTLSKDHAKFLFITFIVENGPSKANWFPKHNFEADFNYDPQTKAYKLEKQRFEYSYPKR